MNSRSSHLRTLQVSQLFWIVVFAAVSIVSLTAQTPSFVTFDAPDAGHNKNQGTSPRAMNQNGVITGTYSDKFNLSHGFVRLANGQITEFDVFPPSIPNVLAINVHNQVVGTVQVKTNQGKVDHGFLRNSDGSIVEIVVPGAVSTSAWTINDSGVIAGNYSDTVNAQHGFLRDAGGNYTLFDVPGAGANPSQGTLAASINNSGEITGNYSDPDFVYHGFLRDPSGTITSFDAPGAGTEFGEGTLSGSLNGTGEIIGTFVDEALIGHPFVRDVSGNITSWSVQGSSFISANAINDQGSVVGGLLNSASVSQGYLRNAAGTITSFSAPVSNTGTYPFAINNKGRIAGYYSDLRSVRHGFVR